MADTPLSRALKDPSLFIQGALVAGEWCPAHGEAVIRVSNPASGEHLGSVPDLGARDARSAIEAASAAWPAWRSTPAKERAAILRRWYDLLLENESDLATLMTLEQGKVLKESRGEIRYAAGYFEFFGEEAKRIYGDVLPSHGRDKRIVVLKQSVGVCAAITPWNFPAAMLARKIAPALAAGCPIVVRPSELTPFSALAMCLLGARAGVPPGVLSCITGKAQVIGREFTSHPAVRKLTFTGSTAVGRELAAQCAATLKHLSLELGGNAPFIVFDDADVESAVAGAIASKFRNSGQTCVCANRIFVQSGIYEAFVQRLCEAVKKLSVGSGFDDGADVGPLISAQAMEKVERHVADAQRKGARCLVGGSRIEGVGHFFTPTVLEGVREDMQCMQEETFGPVAPVVRFDSEAEVMRLANATDVGLAAYFYSHDIRRIWRVAEALEVGMVGINEGIISTELAPFGGIKQSGVGREGSRYGIESYVETKYLCFGELG